MFKHHADTIRNVTEKLARDDGVLAVLVGGSIAHGFETEKSDVDIMIVIPDGEYGERKANARLWYCDTESCTYEGGYVDGKYVSPGFLELVERRGSEPARFAYQGAIVTHSRIDGLREQLKRIETYPVAEKRERMWHFYAQLDAWRWYCHEAVSHENRYLLQFSVSNIILFGGRLILALNETLYPYHKWFLRVLDGVKDKPESMMSNIDGLLREPTIDGIDGFCQTIFEFADWGFAGRNFADYFIMNNELNWLNGTPPPADL